jgi:hypothetical protein
MQNQASHEALLSGLANGLTDDHRDKPGQPLGFAAVAHEGMKEDGHKLMKPGTEGMLSSLESRRDRTLSRVAEYRLSLAHHLRESANRIIEAHTVPALKSDTGKKSAA